MAPIPVYADSPIASKPSGVTPQTACEDALDSGKRAVAPAAVTATPTRPQVAYPQAQPGAAPALPAATTTAHAHVAPLQPTPTQDLRRDEGPPPPQPGAVPKATGTHLPPPPKAGERFVPPPTTSAPQAATMPYPQQMSIPPPTMAYPAQQTGTSTAAAPSSAFTGLGTGHGLGQAESLQHPPGYQQNVNASELDKYQRSAVLRNDSDQLSDADEGVWNSAKKWAQATGEKLAAAETEIWKKINKE
ncbi:hypothetical protein JX265_002638 [Neoarthrinium moseri]|uniref:Uncharacterized protein n=1 Tax=Neoarthrinium moseri TaxID=1658444 RepID=A0A9Q0AQK5_9PEZI|nr:hypothetical protein JX266_011001 [Neoarthrinium moseri]KAI1879684.1 hypothetical protein JX265_002638 [Neoarthrinium moseri]